MYFYTGYFQIYKVLRKFPAMNNSKIYPNKFIKNPGKRCESEF